MKPLFLAGLSASAIGIGFALTSSKSPVTPLAVEVKANAQSPQASAAKEAYYGDLHLHTTQSFDAYTFGTRIGPDEAYRYAKGEEVEVFGEKIKRNFPLDFLAVTDHSENIGVLSELNDTTSLLSRSEVGKKFKNLSKDRSALSGYFFKGDYSADAPGFNQESVTRSAWQRQIDAANSAYQPNKFTSFIAYEWTSAPDRRNLHRNVIFRDAKATDRPFSAIDSKNPVDLWKYLDNLRSKGTEALAIPHNPNASNGLMYDWNDLDGKPIDLAHAQSRALNEPINEIAQNKGQSETHPELSPNDEFANYELVDFMSPRADSVRQTKGSYLRDALGRGLIIKDKVGANPFKFGFVGAGDLHGGLAASDEKGYQGTVSYTNKTPDATLSTYKKGDYASRSLFFGSGHITGVWAESNTREAIYDAFRRKETFATTGTKLKFRFFGGWGFDKNLLANPEWVKKAYAQGVSMGGDLAAKPAASKAPSFAVWGIKDPNGANLDRIQIVKVWVKGDKQFEKIFDVALADGRKAVPNGKVKAVGSTVDTKKATYTNTIGDTELSGVWTDPEFDGSAAAVYYLRVLEIPTPRWTTILAARNNLPLPTQVAATIQERGWSSPIWYTPAK